MSEADVRCVDCGRRLNDDDGCPHCGWRSAPLDGRALSAEEIITRVAETRAYLADLRRSA